MQSFSQTASFDDLKKQKQKTLKFEARRVLKIGAFSQFITISSPWRGQ